VSKPLALSIVLHVAQVQERLTDQIADFSDDNLNP
jgi:GTP cyclohydrolase I